MANYSPSTQAGTGAKTNFVLPWTYLDPSHVSVQVNGVTTPFTWVDTGTIQITPAPVVGASVVISRTTPGDVLVNFTSGFVRASDQNYAYKQPLFRSDEVQAEAGLLNGSSLVATVAAQAAAADAQSASTDQALAHAARIAAEAARDQTLNAFDSFDDRYLGPKSADPTLDNDGNALTAGSLFFDTTSTTMKVYTGSTWVAAYVSGGEAFVLKAGDTMTGPLVLAGSPTSVNDAANKWYVDSRLAGKANTSQVVLLNGSTPIVGNQSITGNFTLTGSQTVSGNLGVGVLTPQSVLDVLDQAPIFGGSRAVSTVKVLRPRIPNWDGDGWFSPFFAVAEETVNGVNIGGGTSTAEAATLVRVFTASTVGTPVGTERLRIIGSGAIGLSGANFGTVGQVPTSNGPSAPPTWTTIQGNPSGALMLFAGASAPTGWLLCAGQAVSRTTFDELFAVISTTYGAGDGSTTFNLPDMRGRVGAGKDDMGGTAANRLTSGGSGVDGAVLGTSGGGETHTLTIGQMPSHSHTTPQGLLSGTSSRGFGSGTDRTSTVASSTGGGLAHPNVQPTLVLNYIIKT